MPGAMLLHEAIETVLREAGRPMHAKDIAAEINRRALYARKDGQPLPANQVQARVAKPEYRGAFGVRDGIISLV